MPDLPDLPGASANDSSLDGPCEEATFCIRQEPAADRPLS